MSQTPEVRTAQIVDARANPPVIIQAAIVRRFPSLRLLQVEAAWAPARQQLAAVQQTAGLQLESSHWNWTRKIERAEQGKLSLVAIEYENVIQGLMAVPIVPRPSVLTPGQSVLYVDYLEAAPWNQRVLDRPIHFAGVGTALIAEAIIISLELGLGGSIGLHSLAQAEQFYAEKCGMTRLGPDLGYYDLEYFEYAEGGGLKWLTARNTA